MAKCGVCFRKCEIKEGELGLCGARTCINGEVVPDNYGKMTSLALDPIEKKPLRRFFPGTLVLSYGSYGCSLRCPFCQNHEISWSNEAVRFRDEADEITPEELAETAKYYEKDKNIGVAYTYNEPLVGYEFVRDTAKLVHEKGMKNILVTSGNASISVLDELAPYIDAMNIDLKGFTDRYYKDVIKGDLQMVKEFIEASVKFCHVEITTLIIPGENDTEDEMCSLSKWISNLNGMGDIPLHISRFFPRFHMTDREATEVEQVYKLAEVARENLKYVYTGNC
ncbi:MAG: AmmeMemoRadiSam system radical SAM enzyme [Lachnospiraceae bacterium]|nr:AmmeMemoRadiSam system radical SAM enzyme [Lachnospiraceae bacterium]